jgi:hypothetical protein
MGGSDENQKSSENYGNLEEMENAKPMDMSTVKMVSLPQLYIYIYIYISPCRSTINRCRS